MHAALLAAIANSEAFGSWFPTQLPNLQSLYLADTGKTLSGNEVTDWADQGPAGVDFSTGGTGPDQQLASENMNGQDTLLFDSAGPEELSAPNLSDFNYLHEGSATAFVVWHKDSGGRSALFDNVNLTTAARGCFADHDVTNSRIIWRVNNGSAAVASGLISGIGGGAHYLVIRHRPSGSPEFDVRVDGVSEQSGSLLNSYGSGDPPYVMHFGTTNFNASALNGEIAMIAFCDDYVPDADVTKFETWAEQHISGFTSGFDSGFK